MFTIPRTRLLTTLLGAVVLFPSMAAAAEAAVEDALPWFEVEMILFTRPAAVAPGERPRTDGGVPDWTRARPLQPGVTPPLSQWLDESSRAAGTGPTPGVTLPVAYELLPETALQLAPEAAALHRSGGALTPVLHLAWRQPMEADGAAAPLYLQWPETGGSRETGIRGLIELSVNRYLHVDVDFLLNEPWIRTGGELTELLDQNSGAVRFQASRRMRSGELHYLDHPRMGMLIEIRRYELPTPPPPEEKMEAPVVASPTDRIEQEAQQNPTPAE